MKKVLKNNQVPTVLSNYQGKNSWKAFKRNVRRKTSVVDQMRSDQRGLCAYCEIDLLPGLDLRVEHFHPKTDAIPASGYWQLKWDNLLVCCHGGLPDRKNASRYPSDRVAMTEDDKHCDVPKRQDDLDAVILNPLKISTARLFEFRNRWCPTKKQDGLEMIPDQTNCGAEVYAGSRGCLQRAADTISRLHLNSEVLMMLRKDMADAIKRKIYDLTVGGKLNLQQASDMVATAMFPSCPNQNWPRFFTVVRWVLGDAAEKRLKEINYNG